MRPDLLRTAKVGELVTPTGVVGLPYNAERAAWLEARRSGVGGTDAAAISGHNRYRSAVQVYFEKTLDRPAKDDTLTPADPRWWGLALEGSIRIAFEYETGLRVHDTPALVRHRENAWQYASLDGLVYKGDKCLGLFEAKTGGFAQMAQWPLDDDEAVPAAYLIQVHHYLMVTGLPKAWICALIGGQRFIVREVTRDPALEGFLLEREVDFMQHVNDRVPPQPDGSASADEALRDAYPNASEDEAVLTEKDWHAVRRYVRAHKEVVAWEKEKATAAQELQVSLGEKAGGYYNDQRAVSWRNVTSHYWDTKALAEDHPELTSVYRKPKITRPFKVPATAWKEE